MLSSYTVDDVEQVINRALAKSWAYNATVNVSQVVGENRGMLTLTYYLPYNDRPQTHTEFVELVTDDFEGDMHTLALSLIPIARGG